MCIDLVVQRNYFQSERRLPIPTAAPLDQLVDEIIEISRFYNRFEQMAASCCGGISVSQCTVLQELATGPQSVSKLANQARLSVSAMTRVIDGLKAKGYVDRSRSEQDRRRVDVHLTDSGRAEAERLRGLTTAVVAGLMAAIPSDQQPQLVSSMRVLRTAMDSVASDFFQRTS